MSLLQDALRKAQKGEGGKISPAGSRLPGGGGARSAGRRRLRVVLGLAAVFLLGAGAVILLLRFSREGSVKPVTPVSAPPPGEPNTAAPQRAPEMSSPASPGPPPGKPRVRARVSPAGPGEGAKIAPPLRAGEASSPPEASVQPEGNKASHLARFNEGIAAQAGGDWETAVRLFQEVVEKDPSIVEGWNNLGNALLRLGKLTDADRALRRALSLDPNYPAALVNAGLLRLQDGRPAEAGPFFARAASLDPRNPAPRVNLAISQARQGALSEAEETLTAARRAFPGNADILYHLGTLYERAGNRDKAREAYDAFLSASAGLRPDRERLVRERLREWDR